MLALALTLAIASSLLLVGHATKDIDPRPCIQRKSNTTEFEQHCSRCGVGQGITMYCIQVRNPAASASSSASASPTVNSWCYKDAVCSECTPGTFQDKQNHSEPCVVCQSCDRDKGFVVARECNATANTVCVCEDGWFLNRTLARCTRCTQCPAGSQPQNCSGESDTKCEACAAGTFSDGRGPCKPCRKCGLDQRVELECTAQSDARCSLLPQLITTAGSGEGESARGSLMIYVSCGLMGLVVFAVVTYAMWKHCNRSIEKKRTTAAYSQNATNPQLYLYMTISANPADDREANSATPVVSSQLTREKDSAARSVLIDPIASPITNAIANKANTNGGAFTALTMTNHQNLNLNQNQTQANQPSLHTGLLSPNSAQSSAT